MAFPKGMKTATTTTGWQGIRRFTMEKCIGDP